MTTLTWSVSSMTVYPQSEGFANVVFSVNWVLTASDTVGEAVYTVPLYNSTAVPLNPDNYTLYEDLTEAEVISWVKDALGVDRVAYFEASATQQVADKINPPIVSLPLPWPTSGA